MRLTSLILLSAGFLAGMTACGSSSQTKPEDTANDKKETDADTDADADADTDADADADTADTGFNVEDTAFAQFTYRGEATVNTAYSGWEELSFETLGLGANNTVQSLCTFRWDVADWDNSGTSDPNPVSTPCTTGGGDQCTFWFTLVATNGAQTTNSGDCGNVFSNPLPADGGDFTYGLEEDYVYAGTYDLGDTLFYYSRANTTWSPVAYTAPPPIGKKTLMYVDLDGEAFEYGWLQNIYYVDASILP